MSEVRIPKWRVIVGTETANKLSDLFAQVMADLPMSQADLAGRIEVDQSTVARWVKGAKKRREPGLERMREAVDEVWAALQPICHRASVAQEALRHVVAAEKATEEDGLGAGKEEVEALVELLEELEEGGDAEG